MEAELANELALRHHVSPNITLYLIKGAEQPYRVSFRL